MPSAAPPPAPARSDADLAVAAALAGARVVGAAHGGPVTRYGKGAGDFATDADLDSERAIRKILAAERPGDAFVGEETGADGPAGASRRWYVDPLCGTLNFAAGTPPFCVNVALAEAVEGETAGAGERVVAAAVADPLSADDEVLWCDGSGAFRRTRSGGDAPLSPTAASRIVDVNVDVGADLVGPGLVADPAFRAAFAVRVVSSTAALAWVADGRRAAYVTDGSLAGSVHFTPGIALCEAAGCVVTDLAGGPVRGGRGLIAAADQATAARVRELIGLG